VSGHRAPVATFVLVVGCSVNRTGLGDLDGGPGAAGASSRDARADVARGIDSGRRDSGGVDAAGRDAASDDAGSRDAGPGDAGPRDAGPRDGGCAFSPRCVGGSLETCVAGTPMTTPCVLGCASARCLEPVPSNVPACV